LHAQQVYDRIGAGSYYTTTYQYGNSAFRHYITQIIDPRGTPVVKTTYDEDGRVRQIENGEGTPHLITTFTHDLDGKTETIVDPKHNKTVHEYDSRGNITRTRIYPP